MLKKFRWKIVIGAILAPLWKLTDFTGVLFDWCRPIEHGRTSAFFRCTVIAISFLILLYLTVNGIFELVMEMCSSSANLRSVLLLLTVSCDLPLTLSVWTTYLMHRNRLLTFFRDWKQLEKQQQNVFPPPEIGKFRFVVYFLYFTLGSSMLLGIVLGSTGPEAEHEPRNYQDLILYFYPNLLNDSYAVALNSMHLLSNFLMVIFIVVADIVPLFIYYHSSKMIECMENQIRKTSEESAALKNSHFVAERVQSIWIHIELIRAMINRADDLFGPIIIVNQGLMFFVTCSISFSLFDMLKNSEGSQEAPAFLTGVFFFSFRLLFGIFFMSELHRANGRLVSVVSELSARHCNSSDSTAKHVIHSFMVRIQGIQLAACPSGFYRITPSIMLTMLSLIVSYTIVLVQSR